MPKITLSKNDFISAFRMWRDRVKRSEILLSIDAVFNKTKETHKTNEQIYSVKQKIKGI